MPSEPIAYFITFTTYGTWLHGRDEGSVSHAQNAYGEATLPARPLLERQQRLAMRQPEYNLSEGRRSVVLKTIREVAHHRRWKLWAVHVRSNHVHIVATGAATPEKMTIDFKAWASRRIREAFGESADRDRWTQGGSTLYLWSEAALHEKIEYVLNAQGEGMARFDGSSEPEA